MGADMGIWLELDAAAAKGILDHQGIAKVRHIDVNRLWLQEQRAKKIVPLSKIPGEDYTSDLMTRHLAIGTILRHMKKLKLVHIGGRSQAAAKLHLVSETAIPVRTTERSAQAIEPTSKKSSNE